MLSAMSSEWLKIRSVRSTTYTLGLVAGGVLVGVLLAWKVADVWDSFPPERQFQVRALSMEVAAVMVAQLCMAVLGVLAITSEYATGMIRSTLTVMPRRLAVLAAKTAVVASIALIVGQASTFATFYAGRLIVGDRPIPPGYTSPAADEIPMLLASGLSVMVFALVGLGLGTVMRSTAAAITTVVALWYVVPIVAMNLPQPWNQRIASVMLPNLHVQLAGEVPDAFAPLLSPLGALAVIVLYVVVALAAGAVAITRRDA